MAFNLFLTLIIVLVVLWIILTAFFMLRYTHNGSRIRQMRQKNDKLTKLATEFDDDLKALTRG